MFHFKKKILPKTEKRQNPNSTNIAEGLSLMLNGKYTCERIIACQLGTR